MKIEIWSDIVCPFCYIGKRNFETALAQFDEAEFVELEWKSFQLDPELPKGTTYADTYQYLAERKGLSIAQAKEMTSSVAATGKNAGVTLNFEKAVIANTWDAHRLIHLAQSKGAGTRVKEALFNAHFTDGKDISNRDTLVELGKKAGLEETPVIAMLSSDAYAHEVAQDIQEARNIGIRGVPFFVFNRKYAVSGAQPPEVFLQTLQKAVAEWRATNPDTLINVTEGPSCSPDGTCD
ncbi:DsbA family oxidoreductase [Parapedobacter indicus]|uniref:Protein disulfide-isomerase n=1 Tax=Parapedobacter indicus TaxID=1477437 RepID=A0A1I3R763_9SPHI|nr:DsbA family oxidoreductase [Parapedobacter indicus]PPL00369.1 protein disulfide-isomerase [Parapedobacter indicus]SFJ41622.1 protein disulfide-isomerase [Parapedobacter indicus]